MAKRPRNEPPGIDWDQVNAINRSVLDSYDTGPTGSTPPPAPSGSSAAVPINPGGLGMRGGKAGGFWYNKGGKVEKSSGGCYSTGGKVLSCKKF